MRGQPSTTYDFHALDGNCAVLYKTCGETYQPVVCLIKIRSSLQFVQLKFQRNILAAVVAVIVGEAAALDLHVLTHVYAPCIV